MLEFQKLKLESFFVMENKPEQILDVLNREGEVIVPATARNRSRQPFYIRILATQDGPKVSTHPIE